MIVDGGESTVWARCRAGKKWFWCVWKRWTDTIIAHGMADSIEECEQHAKQYGPLYEEQARYASNRKRQLAAIRRQVAAAARLEITNDAVIEEFVVVPSDDNSGSYWKHKIMKRTKSKIFVEKEGEPCRADGQPIFLKASEDDWRAWWILTVALDRKAIEHDGRHWHRGTGKEFWISMTRWRQHRSLNCNQVPHRLIATLRLSANPTLDDARATFKKLLAASHPDRGGTSEGFQQLNALKQEYPSILA